MKQRLGPKKERICARVLGLLLVDLRDDKDRIRAYTRGGWPHYHAQVLVRRLDDPSMADEYTVNYKSKTVVEDPPRAPRPTYESLFPNAPRITLPKVAP